MEKSFIEVLDEEKKAGASFVRDTNSTQLKLKPKPGEYIVIRYDELATFLKKSLGRNFTRQTAKKFAEELRKFLGLVTEEEVKEEDEK